MKPTVYQPAFSLSESGFKLPFTITEGVTEYIYELPVTLNTALTEDITCDVTVKRNYWMNIMLHLPLSIH